MVKTVFVDGNPALGVVGTRVLAAFLNKIFNHRHDGLDQDGSGPIDYAADTGAANAYVIALSPALIAHVVGMPITFKATNANTGGATIAINGMDAVAIKQVDGSDLPAGAIVAGQMVTVIYTGAVYMMVSATKAGFGSSLTASGYQKLPSGLIIQWGTTSAIAHNSSLAVTMPIAFPTECLNVQLTAVSPVGITAIGSSAAINSASQITIYHAADTSVSAAYRWLAIGH